MRMFVGVAVIVVMIVRMAVIMTVLVSMRMVGHFDSSSQQGGETSMLSIRFRPNDWFTSLSEPEAQARDARNIPRLRFGLRNNQ